MSDEMGHVEKQTAMNALKAATILLDATEQNYRRAEAFAAAYSLPHLDLNGPSFATLIVEAVCFCSLEDTPINPPPHEFVDYLAEKGWLKPE